MEGKKMLKKTASVLVMLLMMLAGIAVVSAKPKIGVSIWNYTDGLGNDIYNFLTYTAKALDCEVVFDANSFVTEKIITSVENLTAAKCDAIIVCNSSDGVMPKLVKTCENSGVYLAQFFRTIHDPAVAKMVNASKYYIGCTHEDEVKTGYDLGKALQKMGCKKVTIISWNHGDPTAEDRYKGYMKAFKEGNITVLAEQWEILTAEDSAAATERFVAAYPELDAIVVVGGGGEPLAGCISALKNLGKTGKIKVATTDFIPTLREDLEAGRISAINGGHWADPFFSFMLAYNVVTKGYKLTKPAEILNNMLTVSSVAEMDAFNKWFMGKVPPYSAEEIRNFAVSYNPKATLADLINAAKVLSVADVAKRHAGLVN
jgi:ribose transport system substrate-binding protein